MFRLDLVILRPMLTIVLPNTVHTLGSHRVYIRRTHLVKTFFQKGVQCDYGVGVLTNISNKKKNNFTYPNPILAPHALLEKRFN